MNLVAVEAPSARVPLAGEAFELFDAALRVVPASYGLKIITDQLVEALPEGFGFLAGASDELLVDR